MLRITAPGMLATSFANMSLHSSAHGSFACGHRLQQRQPLRVQAPVPFSVEAAHKKGGGSTKNGRDSNSKRRGVKVYGGQPIRAGGIIVRQLGTKVVSEVYAYNCHESLCLQLSRKQHELLLCCVCSSTLGLVSVLAMTTLCMP